LSNTSNRRSGGFFGQARVNVLLLNVALDQAQASMKKAEIGAPGKG